MKSPLLLLALLGSLVMLPRAARAAECGNTEEGFFPWLEAFKKQAVEQGISPRTVSIGLTGASYNPSVIRLDRSQKPFKLTFEKFAAQRITKGRLRRGKKLLKELAPTFEKIDQFFGVPGPIIVAIWGLETDYGENMGAMPALSSLATLAYDCRRAERFRGELLSALKIIERGDLAPAQMLGAWAGELGQTQFLASSYERFAVDFDRDDRVDLINSVQDVLGSTANYLRAYGWKPGGDWKPGSENFKVLASWNKSAIYQKTIALFATKLAAK